MVRAEVARQLAGLNFTVTAFGPFAMAAMDDDAPAAAPTPEIRH